MTDNLFQLAPPLCFGLCVRKGQVAGQLSRGAPAFTDIGKRPLSADCVNASEICLPTTSQQ